MFESSTALAVIEPTILPPALLEAELHRASDYARNSRAQSTLEAYTSDWRSFVAFCTARGLDALPASPEAVAAFLASEAERKLSSSTIGRRAAALKWRHRLAGYASPTDDERVKATLSGIRREIGVFPHKRKAPALAEHVVSAILHNRRTDLKGLRDKAILAFGFATAMRRSELVALDVSDLEFTEQGIRVRIGRSKTDQCGEGTVIPVVHGSVVCPVKAIKDYIAAAGIVEGKLLRSVCKGGKSLGKSLTAQAVANVVKFAMAALGLDPRRYAGHSLRAGFVTSACKKGASQFKVMQTTRHKTAAMLAVYYRDEEIFTEAAGAGLL